MKLHAILTIVRSKKNTIINLGKFMTASLNMHQNTLLSRHNYVT